MKTFHDGKVILHAGDCLDVLRAMPADSIDAVVTDPPYHLTSIVKRFGGARAEKEAYAATSNSAYMSRGFMGKLWDGGDIAFTVELWAEVLRVLKPGGHMVCFGGTRTYHRMVCAIEDAGFEIRDAIMWHYGSGFPKSHDVSKGIDRAAGAAREVIGPNKFFSLNGKGNVNVYGAASRPPETAPATEAARQWQGYGTALKPATEIICLARKPLSESTVASNVLRWGTGAINIDATRIGTTVETWPTSRSYAPGQKQPGGEGETILTGPAPSGRWPANLCHDGSAEVLAGFPETNGVVGAVNDPKGSFGYHGGAGGAYRQGTADSGSAARFFASFPQDDTGKRFHYTSKADADDRLGSRHPTVKPVDLMQWLVRLVCPKGATVLDPFAGTGTTGAASFIEGRLCVLIEREPEYLADIERRMELLLSGADERLWKTVAADPVNTLPLFAELAP